MKNKKTIKQIVNDIYTIWAKFGAEEAVNHLNKLFLKEYNRTNDIEERRLILSNLTVAEMQTGKEKYLMSAKLHSKMLVDELDSFPNYKNLSKANKCKYIKAYNNYVDCYKDELDRKEIIRAYLEYYDTYKECTPEDHEGYLNKLIAKSNLGLITNNFNIVLEIVDILIHNNNIDFKEVLDCLIKDIEKVNIELYKNVMLMIQKEENKII